MSVASYEVRGGTITSITSAGQCIDLGRLSKCWINSVIGQMVMQLYHHPRTANKLVISNFFQFTLFEVRIWLCTVSLKWCQSCKERSRNNSIWKSDMICWNTQTAFLTSWTSWCLMMSHECTGRTCKPRCSHNIGNHHLHIQKEHSKCTETSFSLILVGWCITNITRA